MVLRRRMGKQAGSDIKQASDGGVVPQGLTARRSGVPPPGLRWRALQIVAFRTNGMEPAASWMHNPMKVPEQRRFYYTTGRICIW